jgi:hypothetical protein
MYKCELCQKEFEFKVYLKRHKNNKKPCNLIDKYECKDCNKIFKFKSKLEEHSKTKNHINNLNIQIANNITNNINNINIENLNNYNIDIIINSFEKTNLNKLTIIDINKEYYDNIYLENIFKVFENEGILYPSNEYFVHCFNYFIKIFTKLNFNIAYSENHNCRCISFKRIDSNVIEYQILSIDNIVNEYTWDVIAYSTFIEKFLELMQNIDKKFNSEKFKKVLEYINKYKSKFLLNDNDCKMQIESNLLEEYNKFKQSRDTISKEVDEEEQRRIEYYRDLKLDAKRMTLAKRAYDMRIKNKQITN